MRSLIGLLAGAALLAASGCSTLPKVHSEKDPAANLGAYRTFHLMELPANVAGADPGLMLRIGPTITSAVNEGFTARGYQPAAEATADVTVFVRGEVVPRVEVTDWGYMGGPPVWGRGRYYYPAYVQHGVSVDTYKEATLAIEVYDRQSKKMVWVGWTTGRLSKRAEDKEKLRTVLEQIIANFPAAQR